MSVRYSSLQQSGVPSPLQALALLWVRLWTEYPRAGCYLHLGPFHLPVHSLHKRPAVALCESSVLLSSHPFPARPLVPDGASRGGGGLPQASNYPCSLGSPNAVMESSALFSLCLFSASSLCCGELPVVYLRGMGL